MIRVRRGRFLWHSRLAVLALVIAALFSGSVRGDSVYFFCSAMGELRSEPCCPRASSGAGDVGHATVDCPCCEAHRVQRLPSGVPDTPRPTVAASPSAALLAAFADPTARSLDALPAWTHRPQTGPPRDVDRVRLMVFRN
ncbi:MAG: hypothetical protein JOZ69_14030 [Myxococcales bacterium]|nr:hypothetical protein [Myxococcales bacterium]